MKILSGTIARYWMRILLAIVALVVLIASKMWIWDSELLLYQKFDLTLKTIGGLLATGAISIAFWRTRSAEKGQYSDRFAKAVEQVAHDQLAIRLGGLASIEALSKETEDEFIRVWTYLGAFLRYPPKLAPWRNEPKAGETKEEQKEPLGQRPDIAAVAAMLHDSRNKTHLRWIEGNQLPLGYANLQSADLQDANLQNANLGGANLQDAELQGARLSEANLQDAKLLYANLQGARLFKTNLQDAHLIRANLQGADLFNANLQDAHLIRANLQGADLFNANLQGADLGGANLQGAELRNISLRERDLPQLFSKDHEPLPLLQDALFSLDVLKKALHIKGLMPEKMSEVYYDASDGLLPDNWPDDKPKPRRITFEEWVKIRDELY